MSRATHAFEIRSDVMDIDMKPDRTPPPANAPSNNHTIMTSFVVVVVVVVVVVALYFLLLAIVTRCSRHLVQYSLEIFHGAFVEASAEQQQQQQQQRPTECEQPTADVRHTQPSVALCGRPGISPHLRPASPSHLLNI